MMLLYESDPQTLPERLELFVVSGKIEQLGAFVLVLLKLLCVLQPSASVCNNITNAIRTALLL